MGPDGLRCPPAACRDCPHKTVCLRTALASDSGVKVRIEMVDRFYAAGHIGFLKRWWQRKNLVAKTACNPDLKRKKALTSALMPWKKP